LGDVAAAAREALADARRRGVEASSGPALVVTGEPAGAELELDGEYLGELPYRGPVEPGAHRLLVRRGGYREHARSFSVPNVAGHVERIEIVLEPLGAAQPDLAANFAIAGALPAAGIAFASHPLYTLAHDRACADGAQARHCRGWSRF